MAATGSGHVLVGANNSAAPLLDTNGVLAHTFISHPSAPWDSFGTAIAAAGNNSQNLVIGQPDAGMAIADAVSATPPARFYRLLRF